MDRRNFFKRAALVAAAVVVAPSVLETIAESLPAFGSGTGYATYITGTNAMYTLTVADIRRAVAQLKSTSVLPYKGQYIGYSIHPQVAKDLRQWTGEGSSRD